MIKHEEGHYIMIKESMQEEDITIVDIYAPNTGASQYIRQMLRAIKGEIDSNTIIVGDFNTTLSIGESGVLKSPTMIVLLSISPFMAVSICLMY